MNITTALLQTGKVLGEALDIDDLSKRVVSHIPSIIKVCKCCLIYLWDGESFVPAGAWGLKRAFLTSFKDTLLSPTKVPFINRLLRRMSLFYPCSRTKMETSHHLPLC